MRGVEALEMLHWGIPHLLGAIGAELGQVADRDVELSLAQRASGVMGAARRDAECDWLCGAAFLLLLLRDFLCFGWVEGAPGESFKMADEGASADSMAGRRGGGGAGS